MSAEPTVRSLHRDELLEAGGVLARSHADDPAFGHVYPQPHRRERALTYLFRQWCHDALPFGRVLAAELPGRIVGVAIWLPPSTFPPGARRLLRGAPLYIPVLAAAPRSYSALLSYMTAAARHHPEQEAWYLEVLGLDDGHRGRGIGPLLLEPVLEQADRERSACYLETAKRRNVGWYERLGFRVTAEDVPLVKGGPTHWQMWRPPPAATG
jgi:GNAT superfamily N-acetyltransferase